MKQWNLPNFCILLTLMSLKSIIVLGNSEILFRFSWSFLEGNWGWSCEDYKRFFWFCIQCFIISSKMARSGVDETSESGAFVRTASTFRNFVSQDPHSQFPAESGRYHLYISYACPWACRCLSYLKIKGLDEAISFSVCTIHLLYLAISMLY